MSFSFLSEKREIFNRSIRKYSFNIHKMLQTTAYFYLPKQGGVVSFVVEITTTKRYDLLAVCSVVM